VGSIILDVGGEAPLRLCVSVIRFAGLSYFAATASVVPFKA
jgi:hypothetical protein